MQTASLKFNFKCSMTSKLPRIMAIIFLVTLTILLQPQHIVAEALRPFSTTDASPNQSATNLSSDHCVALLGSNKVIKEIGSVWVSPENPCIVHVCETDSKGLPQIKITNEDCAEIYCDVDSELRAKDGTCCGICVRTKCRFNDTVYDIGQTWHNKNDCTLLECSQLQNGQPIINAYQKTCPPLPRDCAAEERVFEDCCYYCKGARGRARSGLNDENDDEDLWTEEFYRNHSCVRECRPNEPPRTCHYTFVVEWYETLSKACYECPRNTTDCKRPHCITGDGIRRSITTVNRMMPGPSVEVCENDIIVVDVHNDLLGDSTTVHWHGLHQRATPYMDGVPHISQCPISPHSTFRYTFKADNVGTHFWHSHTGMQRGDGMFGALIIRRPRSADPHGHLYDFDLSEHVMLLQDWVQMPGVSVFASHHHSRGDNKPHNILINGKGRFYNRIWEMIKSQARIEPIVKPKLTSDKAVNISSSEAFPKSKLLNATSPEETPPVQQSLENLEGDVDFLHSLDNEEEIKLRSRDSNEILRLARLVRGGETLKADSLPAMENMNTTINMTTKLETSTRAKRAIVVDDSVSLDKIPLHVYNVRQGFRYRFRIINAEFLNCPTVVSIDNHSLTAINSDGYDFEAVEVGSIVTYAGERFDFILNADQPVGNYWIRFKGLMDCDQRFTSAFQVAILHYEDAADGEPSGELKYDYKADGIELNAMNRGSGYVDSLTMAELTALSKYDTVPGVDRDVLKPTADYKFFVYYDFYPKDNPSFHKSDYYGFNANLSDATLNRVFTPQLNHISLKFPAMALLPSRDQINDSMFCNDTSLQAQGIDCRKEFCKCHHVLQVPLNAIVEFIIVDEGFAYDANHPFHLHGNAFRVVGIERLGQNVTVEMVKQLERYNLLKRNLVRPPIKDTVTVPDGGYTIIRFKAYNPGFWLFHCHIEFHAEIGMALVLKVGNNNQMPPVPKNFPTCQDYIPVKSDDSDKDEININTSNQDATATATVEPDKSIASQRTSSSIFLLAVGLYILTIFKSS